MTTAASHRTKRVFSLLLSALAWSCTDEGHPGEIAIYTGAEDGSPGAKPFSVRLAVNGNFSTCGECAAVTALVEGGVEPYMYQWSDPTLSGAGPHTVCPRASTRYAVVVTDASGVAATVMPQNALGTALVECTPATSDAGPSADGLNGCLVLGEAQEVIKCSTNDVPEGNVNSKRLGFKIVAGRTYQYTYNQLLPIGIGTPSTVDVYMGMTPCERGEKVFTLRLDSTPSQSYCFTPKKDYLYNTDVIQLNGIPVTFGVTPIVCDSCAGTTSSQ